MPSEHMARLQLLWEYFLAVGATDQYLHELVTLAQDMECDRIASLLDEMVAKVDPRTASLLGALRDTLRTRGHRPA